MRKFALFLGVLFFSTAAFAALVFPALTGRVVDDAHILSPGTIQTLDQMLASYEAGTTNQVVVATLPSLQGTSIEDYGYQLGRHWGIGQKGKDNGVLLIVAPHERKVRIEVGYGLEGTLTDAISAEIIQGIILPDFKQRKMETGIIEGTRAIVSVLGGKSVQTYAAQPQPQENTPLWVMILLWLPFIYLVYLFIRYPSVRTAILVSNSVRFGGSGSFGGGFSGGGGGFGGGGASGGW